MGFGFQTPTESCTDAKCPFHGKLKVHGRIFHGIVSSAKVQRSITVSFDRTKYISKYERYEKKQTHIKAHNPPCMNAKEGENVTISECRPLSKTKRFVVVQKE